MFRPRLFLVIAVLFGASLMVQGAFETWNKRMIRVFTQGKTANGEVIPIVGQEVMIWLDKPALQDKLEEAMAVYDRKDSISRRPLHQMVHMVHALGDPDIRRTTDENGNAFFEGAKLDQRVLVVVVNIAPQSQAGGVYAGVKEPMSLRAVTRPVNQRGLLNTFKRVKYGYDSPPLSPKEKEAAAYINVN